MGISFSQYLTHLRATAWSTFEIAMLLLCLTLWLHRQNPTQALQRMRLTSIWFNFAVAAIDAFVVAIPLTILAFKFSALSASLTGGWTLFPFEESTSRSILVALLAIFLGDFVAYWRHRLEHTGWLWKSHVMHHSDGHMNWSTIYRFHPINRVTTVLVDGTALLLMGFPIWAIVLNNFVRHYYGVFVHIDQPWTLGWVGKILVSPAMHRWHHVREGNGVGKNFASIFSIFDRIFGTYYCPGPCAARLGVSEVRDTDIVTQYLFPFRRESTRINHQAKQ